MFHLLIILFLSVLVNEAYSAAAIQPSVPKPPEFADQEGCYIPDLNMVLPFDKPYSPADGKSCIEYNCLRTGDTSIYTCGVIAVSKDQKRIEGDKTLPYPKCCDTVAPKKVKKCNFY